MHSVLKLAAVLATALLWSCASVLVPNPPSARAPASTAPRTMPPRPVTPPPDTRSSQSADTLDFALAFATPVPAPVETLSVVRGATRESARRSGVAVERTVVRVGLAVSVPVARIVLPDQWGSASARGRRSRTGGGPATARVIKGRREMRLALKNGRVFELALPCTLVSRQREGMMGVDSLRVRGRVVVVHAGGNALSVVNALPVEEYLRGVVPLEIGRRGPEEMEALKAQAVAARTYTYRKMAERRAHAYDVVATVADQVYGGAGAEASTTDRAVMETAGLVLAVGSAPIIAYYHSTCGGRTANIEDVWDKPQESYLRSVDDHDPAGNAYCASSRYASWRYTWNRQKLSSTVARYGRDCSCDGAFAGTLKKLAILSTFSCGRVHRLRVTGSRGTADFCGDKTRFALRRPETAHAILPSSRFRVVSQKGDAIVVEGGGYGHGVGMCQMGALGRARAGQSFDRILKTYYTGVDIVPVEIAPLAAR